MKFKKMLHELIDSLDEAQAKHIYHLVLGFLGRG